MLNVLCRETYMHEVRTHAYGESSPAWIIQHPPSIADVWNIKTHSYLVWLLSFLFSKLKPSIAKPYGRWPLAVCDLGVLSGLARYLTQQLWTSRRSMVRLSILQLEKAAESSTACMLRFKRSPERQWRTPIPFQRQRSSLRTLLVEFYFASFRENLLSRQYLVANFPAMNDGPSFSLVIREGSLTWAPRMSRTSFIQWYWCYQKEYILLASNHKLYVYPAPNVQNWLLQKVAFPLRTPILSQSPKSTFQKLFLQTNP